MADYSLTRQPALILVSAPTDRADQRCLCTAVTHCTGEMTPAAGMKKHEQDKGTLQNSWCRVLSWTVILPRGSMNLMHLHLANVYQ